MSDPLPTAAAALPPPWPSIHRLYRSMAPVAMLADRWLAARGGPAAREAQCAFLRALNDAACLRFPPSRAYTKRVVKRFLADIEAQQLGGGDADQAGGLEDGLAELAAEHCSELASRGVGGANEGSFYRAFIVGPVSVALRCVSGFGNGFETGGDVWAGGITMAHFAVQNSILDGGKAVQRREGEEGREEDSKEDEEGDAGEAVGGEKLGSGGEDIGTNDGYIFKDRDILEIGSGTGMVGLSLAMTGVPRSVTLTDYMDSVIDALRVNTTMNRCPAARGGLYVETDHSDDDSDDGSGGDGEGVDADTVEGGMGRGVIIAPLFACCSDTESDTDDDESGGGGTAGAIDNDGATHVGGGGGVDTGGVGGASGTRGNGGANGDNGDSGAGGAGGSGTRPCPVRVARLDLRDEEMKTNMDYLQADVVVAADVTYDQTLCDLVIGFYDKFLRSARVRPRPLPPAAAVAAADGRTGEERATGDAADNVMSGVGKAVVATGDRGGIAEVVQPAVGRRAFVTCCER